MTLIHFAFSTTKFQPDGHRFVMQDLLVLPVLTESAVGI
jgi:hypothetical protein